MDFYECIQTSKQEAMGIISDQGKNYLSYPISKKSGKKRWLDAPLDELKEIQSRILYSFLYNFSAHDAAVGFVSGIGVADGALRHLGRDALLCMDLSNFFNSIKTANVYKLGFSLFNRYKKIEPSFTFTREDLKVFVKLVTYKGQLPQGSPTSPALANLYCIALDHNLSTYSEIHGLLYTRYADDLTFSHSDKSEKMGTHIKPITEFIEMADLKVNPKKTRIRKPNQRMSITGVVVNKKLSVPKWKWRNFRAKLHNINRDQKTISLEEYQQMRGYCEWIKSLHPVRGNQFLTQLGKMTLKT